MFARLCLAWWTITIAQPQDRRGPDVKVPRVRRTRVRAGLGRVGQNRTGQDRTGTSGTAGAVNGTGGQFTRYQSVLSGLCRFMYW
jgi:hypothetical protein